MIFALFLTTLAASTTIIGGIFGTLIKKDNPKITSLALSFSAGVMICLSLFEIIPKSINHFNKLGYSFLYSLLFFTIGALLVLFIHKLAKKNENKLQKIGIISFILLTIHNFPEGMATFSIVMESKEFSWPLILAIAIHNFPEGLLISFPIFLIEKNRKKAIIMTVVSALAEPIGGFFGYYLFKIVFSNLSLGVIFSLISGIMIFLSIFQLLPEAHFIGGKKSTFYGTIIGSLFMTLSLIALNFS